MDLRNINNIIFDLGNVLIDIDPLLTISEIENYGGESWMASTERNTLEEWLHEFEKGRINPVNFYRHVCDILSLNMSFEEFVEVWNKTLIGIPEERWELVRNLSQDYNLYILSNTNEIHIRTIFFMYKRAYGQQNLFEFMSREYYSNLIGLRKPEKKIFEFVFNDAQIAPEETLFIDDSRRNIVAAMELGVQTHLVSPNDEISDLF